MASVVPIYRRYRKNFSKIKEVLEISNLIEVQKRSYEQFLQAYVDPDKREPIGLQAVFKTVFPIKDFYETASSNLSITVSPSRNMMWKNVY